MPIKAAPAALTALAVAACTPCIESTELAAFPPEPEDAGCGAAFNGPEGVGRVVFEVEEALAVAAVLAGIVEGPEAAVVVGVVLRGARKVEMGGAAFLVVVVD